METRMIVMPEGILGETLRFPQALIPRVSPSGGPLRSIDRAQKKGALAPFLTDVLVAAEHIFNPARDAVALFLLLLTERVRIQRPDRQ
ncbi:hypothetical protein EIO60_01806|nr:hypothetical protein [Candidatus Pantoea persica]